MLRPYRRDEGRRRALVELGAAQEGGRDVKTQICDIDGKALDHRVWLMARAMARVLYPGITDAELERPTKRWNGIALADAECTVWQDFIPEAEAALAALREAGVLT
jgi:hypothetical protein